MESRGDLNEKPLVLLVLGESHWGLEILKKEGLKGGRR